MGIARNATSAAIRAIFMIVPLSGGPAADFWIFSVFAKWRYLAGTIRRYESQILNFKFEILYAASSLSVRSAQPCFVGFAKSIPRVCDCKRAVTLRRHLDPICRAIVLRRRRNVWARGWRRHRSDRHGFRLIIDRICDEHARRSVLLPAEQRKMKLP